MAKRKTLNLVHLIVGAIVLVLIGGYALLTMQKSRKDAAETAAAWMITGNPCPTPGSGPRPALSHQTAFEDVRVEREVGGQAACNTIRENGDGETLKICQFIAPGALRVATTKGLFEFAPPRGIDASLVIRGDVPSCVLHINPALFKD